MPTSLAAGDRLGAYTIVSLIGKGGMGEVYKARDEKLERDVAIKVLPDAFLADVKRVERLEREAKLLASLNHANIATLHALEEQDGRKFLVMELVEGPTLADRIARGPMPLEEARPLFEQMANGLEVAHDRGIIHRDLKPDNVKIDAHGQIKILDFGLAKALVGEYEALPLSSQSPTETKGSLPGAIIGTAFYMSPEQARGEAVDRRCDVWAFGCCLYEALTGKKAFDARTLSDVLAEVLKAEPDWRALPESIPESIRLLLRRCLSKDPRNRLRAVGDAGLELRETAGSMDSSTRSAGSRRAVVAAALLGAVVAGGAVYTATRRPIESRSPSRLTLRLPAIAPRHAAVFPFSMFQFDVSLDGEQIVYVGQEAGGNPRLYLRSLSDLTSRPIPDTDNASTAFFAPDGRSIGFYADGELKRVALDGSQSSTLAAVPSFNGARWGADDRILFADERGLFRISARGGEPVLVTAPETENGEQFIGWPDLLPSREHALVTIMMDGSIVDDPRTRVVAVSLETGERRLVVEPGGNARYLPTGHVVFGWWGLHAVAFDPDRLETSGLPVPVVQDVRSDAYIGTDFSVSHEGKLVYFRGPALGAPARIRWMDRDGRESKLVEELRPFRFPRLSPDGEKLAVAIGVPGQSHIWVYDVAGDPPRGRRLTSESNNSVPVWTPDGTTVTFASNRDGPRNLYGLPADGSAIEPQRITETPRGQHGLFWTPDASEIVFYQNEPGRAFDIAAFAPRRGEWRAVVETPFFEGQGALSPDGKWLAFTSDVDGEGFQIYLRPFEGEGGTVRVSREAGSIEPAWAPDGSELYFTHDGNMMAATIDERNGEIRVGTPTALFSGFLHGGGPRSYDVARDGRFLVITPPSTEADDDADELVIVLDWLDELARLVPTER